MGAIKSLITASQNDEQTNFIDLYREMIITYKKENKDALDARRLIRLSASIDSLWKDFDVNKQQELVRLLVKHELLPRNFEMVIDKFNCSFPKITLI